MSSYNKFIFSAKINKCLKKFIYIFLHNNDCEIPYIEIYIDLVSINLTSDQWFWNLYCTNNNLIAKYIVLCNIISVVSDNILRICIPEPLLILKTFIFLLHTSSVYKSLLVRYKAYWSDRREGLCTQSERYGEAYENFSIDQAPCRKNPIKKIKLVSP